MIDPSTPASVLPINGSSASATHPTGHVSTHDNTAESALHNTLHVALPPEKAVLFLAAIVESSQDSIVTVDFEGTITSWNRAAEQLYGYSAKEAIGQSLGALVLPHNLQEVLSNIDQVKHSQRVEIFDSVRLNKDEQELILEIMMSPVKDEAGQVIGVSTMARDATQRKRAEEALHESQANLAIELADTQQLQSISSLLIEEENIDALYERILESAITLMHSDAGSLQVLDPEQNELRLLACKGFHPDAAVFWEKVDTKTGSTCGAALTLSERLVIADIQTSDFAKGSESLKYYELSGIMAVQSTPLVSREGHVVGMVSTHWHAPHTPGERELKMLDVLARQTADLIERRRAQEALRESEARFRTLSESVPALIWVNSGEGCESVNREYLEFLGASEAEILGFGWKDFVHPDDRHEYAAAFQSAVECRGLFEAQFRFRRRDGEYRWMKSTGLPRFSSSGDYLGYIGSTVDITDIEQSQAKLRESEGRLRALVENLPGGAVFVLDHDLRYLVAEGEALAAAGFKPNDLIERTIFEALPPELAAEYEPNFRKALAGQPYEVEHDAHGRSFISRGVPLNDGNGGIHAVLAISYDITDRKRAEEALRESEARWRLLIEGAHEFAIFMLGLDNTILTWNSGAERITGLIEEEAIGQSGAIIFTPEDRAAGAPEQEMQTAWREGHAADERWHLRKSGECFWASGVLMAMRDEAGNPQGFVKIFRDANAQKQAIESLQTSEARFRTLSDAVPQLVWTNDGQGEANYFNDRWYDYSGLSYEESYGLGWQAIVHPDDAPASVKNWHQSLAEGEVFEAEYRLRRANGTYGWHIGRNVPLRNEESQVVGWFGTATDIGELKEAQEALWQAHDQLEERVQQRTVELKHINQVREQLLERLVNVQEEERHRISRELHDVLGQELTALLMGLQVFPENPQPTPILPSGAPPYPQQVTKLRGAVRRLIEQVQRLAWEMRPAELDNLGLPKALEQYVEEWSAQYGIKAAFVHNLPQDELSTTGPIEVALYRVTQEALTNVQRHAHATNVSVILEKDKTSLRAIVEDDGRGFDTEKDEQGHERTTSQRLGLLGMQERMELVGGTLTIESELGVGTTVYACAPVPMPLSSL